MDLKANQRRRNVNSDTEGFGTFYSDPEALFIGIRIFYGMALDEDFKRKGNTVLHSCERIHDLNRSFRMSYFFMSLCS